MKDREPWLATVHGVSKSQTWWSDWTTTKQVSAISWCVKYVCRDSKEASVQFYLSALTNALSHVWVSHVWLCNPMDCTLSGSSVHGISQTGIPEWVSIPSSRGSSRPRDQTCISCFLHWQVDSFTTEPPHVAQQDIVSNLEITIHLCVGGCVWVICRLHFI